MFELESSHGQAAAFDAKSAALPGHFRYAIPHDLLCKLEDEFHGTGFTPAELEEEFAFAETLNERGRWVGLQRGSAVKDDLLLDYPFLPLEDEVDRPRNQELGGIDIKELAARNPGMDFGHLESALSKGNARTKRIWAFAQAYAGWLMASPEFLAEHDRLLSDFRVEIENWGLPQLSRPVAPGAVTPGSVQASERQNIYCDAFDNFYLKWRLSSLAGPGLPVPFQPWLPAPPTILSLGKRNEVGKLFYFPDTFPIPSTEELRELIEEALRGGPKLPSHLAEWGEMVSNRTSSKNESTRYGRIFEVQHYWCLLYQRHPQALDRRRGKLEIALAGFLGCSAAALHADVLVLNKRLGENWGTRRTGLEGTADNDASPLKPPTKRKPR